MSRASEPLTEADILSDIVAPDEPTLNREFARAVLSVRFNDSATEMIRELLQKNNAGTITAAEKSRPGKVHAGRSVPRPDAGEGPSFP